MKSRLVILSLCIACDAANAKDITIKGKVQDKHSGKPLTGVLIGDYRERKFMNSVKTDAQGNFLISVPEKYKDSVRLCVTKNNYYSSFLSVKSGPVENVILEPHPDPYRPDSMWAEKKDSEYAKMLLDILAMRGHSTAGVNWDTSFNCDLGFSSLEAVELIMDIEDKMGGIDIPDEQAEMMTTMGQAIIYLETLKK